MTFIFQAKPSIYDISSRLKIDKEVGWLASRYKEKMQEGDVVYYWRAGEIERRGIYGWGEISSRGTFVDNQGTYRIGVRCIVLFPQHLNVSILKSHPVLKNLQILRSSMGTNFLLTEKEHESLKSLIADIYGSEWLPTKRR
ncbi:MAG: EVE domain-containing protein [Prolixibacteraceae bacterium]|nr:EVE domain-containing protein [Prolixibacteraceae bacterium]